MAGKHSHAVAFHDDDPPRRPAADLRSHAGPSSGQDKVFDQLTIPDGRVAVLTCKGPYADVPGARQALAGG